MIDSPFLNEPQIALDAAERYREISIYLTLTPGIVGREFFDGIVPIGIVKTGNKRAARHSGDTPGLHEAADFLFGELHNVLLM